MLLEERGIKAEQGARNDLTSATVAEVAEECGVPKRTAFRRLADVRNFDALPEPEKEKVRQKKATVRGAARQTALPPPRPLPTHPERTWQRQRPSALRLLFHKPRDQSRGFVEVRLVDVQVVPAHN
jgi:hypothetical protein